MPISLSSKKKNFDELHESQAWLKQTKKQKHALKM
jgi:hypothetical protein